MIRLTELKLPLDHPEDALPALITRTLGIQPGQLRSHTVYKRSYDARKQKLLLVYIADVEVASADLETELLARFQDNPHIRPAPDQSYHLVTT
ncbi:MAG: FAD-dependent oxidoreductase, partial [Polaromonas sp.]|nr:FAD-dependent oxidoreductase [Polaromonas sp.]